MVERKLQGVVERRRSFGSRLQQRGPQLGNVVRERHRVGQAQPRFAIEIDDEHFVIVLARSDELERSGHHVAALIRHAAAIIDDQPHGRRRVLRLKNANALFAPVFVNVKAIGGEARDGPAVPVENGHVKHDKIDINRNCELEEQKNR